jgi:hypothetical protein
MATEQDFTSILTNKLKINMCFAQSDLKKGKKKNIPFWALEIGPYSASSYLEAPQPSTHVPDDV